MVEIELIVILFCSPVIFLYCNIGIIFILDVKELRERHRAASWSTPRMAPKADREWQNSMDALEERVMENIEKMDKKITENIQGLCEKLSVSIGKKERS